MIEQQSSKIALDYRPRYPKIHEILESHRFVVLVAHRRFGKTVLSINHLIKQASLCRKERGIFAYVGPLRNQAKTIAWSYLKHYTGPIPNVRISEAELSVTLPNGSTIRIFGADNPDSLRGLYFDGIILDEVAQMKPEVWGEIIQPALIDRHGWALFIGTPKGLNLFSTLYFDAIERVKNGDRNWCAMSFPVDKTNVLNPEEVERLRDELSEMAFRQEMLCDFSASSDNILISLDDVKASMNRVVDPKSMWEWPLVVGVDVARYGSDATIFMARRGMYVYSEPVVLRKCSTIEVSNKLLEYLTVQDAEHVFIDAGSNGGGVIDYVREVTKDRRLTVHEVPFGSQANESRKYNNRRTEMWVKMRDWIRAGGKLPNNSILEQELTTPTYTYTVNGKIALEKKDEIKKRLKRSTDFADALCLTFAVDFPPSKVSLQRMYDRYGPEASSRMVELMLRGEAENVNKSLFSYGSEIKDVSSDAFYQ